MPRPIPVPDELSKPFWDACNERKLMVQHCTTCDRRQYPPAQTCGGCKSSSNLQWEQMSGRGKIAGYVVVHDSRIGALHAYQPFNLAVVALDEDPALMFFSNLPGRPVDDVPVGAAVQVDFVQEWPEQLYAEWKVV